MKYLVLFFCIIPCACIGQFNGLAYHQLKFNLDSLLTIARDTNQYLKKFENLPTDSLLETEIFTAARIYSIKKNYEKFRKYSILSMELGQSAQVIIDITSFDGTSIPAKEKKLLFASELDSWKNYFKIVDKYLFDEIKEMVIVDSKIRELYFLKKMDYAVVKTVDSVNIIAIRRIIDKYGMITERKHGALFHSFFSLINHCMYYNYKDFEWMRKLFYNAVMAGDVDPNEYAYFVDRFEVFNNRPQIYGSFKDNIQFLDKEKVDIRRRSIGTCNLQNWRLLRKGRM
jgi:hypothetical protein